MTTSNPPSTPLILLHLPLRMILTMLPALEDGALLAMFQVTWQRTSR